MKATILKTFVLILLILPSTTFSQVNDKAFINFEEDALIYPASYQLNAMDSKSLADFYMNNLGMTLLEEVDGYYRLGTSDERTLLEIFPTDIPRGEGISTGLYHTAYLFNDRQYMGSLLTHMMETESPIEGFTYHGVSDAIYAADIEGNGIELYWDYPIEEWSVNEDSGDVEMQNDPLDYIKLMQSATEEGIVFDQLDERTIIGHFHLVSDDYEAAGKFYEDVLGLKIRSFVEDDSLFQDSNAYHHHLANNNWFVDQDMNQPEEGQQGLRNTIWHSHSPEFFDEIILSLDNLGLDYELVTETELSFKDTNGLGVIVKLVE
ncbi:VOC family protein [Aerococcaceae bacterium WGS1372]